MSFRIVGLPMAPFARLFELSDEELWTQGVVRKVVDQYPGFPCRVSLRDAQPGETVLLLNYEHLAVASPYRARHAIFVRQGAIEADLREGEVPEVLRRRLLSVRAFDSAGMMLDADVVDGREVEGVIERMLSSRPDVEYLHVHNAKPGCFAARVERTS